MHMHTVSLKLACTALLCLLQTIHVAADYQFEVDIRSYSNPEDLDSNGDCCDCCFFFGCPSCEPYYDSFCLRSAGHSRSESTTCPLGSSGSRITSLPATVAITGTEPWPGGFQLYIRVQDEDDFSDDDLIDRIFPESNIGPSSTFSDTMSFPGDSGRATLGLRFRVTCRQDYYGADCDTFCQPRNDSEGHYDCDGNGNVVCLDGYMEPSINCIIPVCMPGCDPDGGFCEMPGECMCRECWNGSLCDQCTGQGCGTCLTVCSSSPCENGGTCLLVGIDDYMCICPMGFEGDNCENVTNECASNPCRNGGTCRDGVGGYNCTCAPDFTGQNCENNIDDCENVTCQENSVCVDEVNSFECVCNPGFEGPNCKRIPEGNACDFLPCANGSTCMESGSNYVCVCASGFTGENCTTNINDCEGVTCPGNSMCTDGVECVCNPGYSGPQCEETEGSGEPEGRGSQESPKGAIIAGAVVGGIVMLIFLVLVLLVVIFLIRKRSRKLDLSPGNMCDFNKHTYEQSAIEQLSSTDVLTRSLLCEPYTESSDQLFDSPNISGRRYEPSSPPKSDLEMEHLSPSDDHNPPALQPGSFTDNPLYGDPNAGFSTMIPDVSSSGDSGTLHRLDNPLYGDDLRGTEPGAAIYSEPDQSGVAIYSEPDQSGVAIYSEPDQSGTAIYSEPAPLVQHDDEPYAYAYTRKHDMENAEVVPNPAYGRLGGPGDSTDMEYHKLDHGTLKEKPQRLATAEGTTYDALQF